MKSKKFTSFDQLKALLPDQQNEQEETGNPESEGQAQLDGSKEKKEDEQQPAFQEYHLGQVKEDLISTDKDPREIARSLPPDEQLKLCHGLINYGAVNFFRPNTSLRNIVTEKASIMMATALREQSERKTEPQRIYEKISSSLPEFIYDRERWSEAPSGASGFLRKIATIDALRELALLHGSVSEFTRTISSNSRLSGGPTIGRMGRPTFDFSVRHGINIPRFKNTDFLDISEEEYLRGKKDSSCTPDILFAKLKKVLTEITPEIIDNALKKALERNDGERQEFEAMAREAKANLKFYKKLVVEVENNNYAQTLSNHWEEEKNEFQEVWERFGKELINRDEYGVLSGVDSTHKDKWRNEFKQVHFGSYAPDVLAKLREIEIEYLMLVGEEEGLIDKDLTQANPEEETEISLDEANARFKTMYGMVDAPYFGEMVGELIEKLTPNQRVKFKETLSNCIESGGYRFAGKKMTRSGAALMYKAAEKTIELIDSMEKG